MRRLTVIDKLLSEIDQSLRTVHAQAPASDRDISLGNLSEVADLTDSERKKAASLMRINHAGEVSAQGLYRGQALTAKDPVIKAQMEESAAEENDHLNWCEARIKALDSHKSYLNPVWYWGSFGIGALAGKAGDRWSLGFVKETEDQVTRHLNSHLQTLPAADKASHAVLLQMKEDEQHHADVAQNAGAAKLPWPVRKVFMPITAKVMTGLSGKI
ncbi:2-polyprenyl-3-methyl-6-methoxy-1,4-benzoquinone monooxygenase [Leucothrix pacifica]|uniref:3-demethoxyubiquinol 3-hydroxylase n=1 Tax=Leucothrix pacifica TaxID=1247513 RepID=A0A317CM74_9GAMM|nr:2-polyprenyl-3-methyl-6-methoxy-1,4-benzoquinone monooxygenase [Leucothrix pacifica]PWQ99419.1 demethoxyubiquinone hydroxylase family protein [Leucothrix pacifica]